MQEKRYRLDLTDSQHMALTDLIAHFIQIPDQPEVFINCSRHPAVETTVGELLSLVTGAAMNDTVDADEKQVTIAVTIQGKMAQGYPKRFSSFLMLMAGVSDLTKIIRDNQDKKISIELLPPEKS